MQKILRISSGVLNYTKGGNVQEDVRKLGLSYIGDIYAQ